MAPGEAGQLPATGHQDHGSLAPADAGRHRSSAAGGQLLPCPPPRGTAPVACVKIGGAPQNGGLPLGLL